MDTSFDWLSENFTIGKLTYWTGYADAAESVVSSGNGWNITRDGSENSFTLSCYNEEIALGFDLCHRGDAALRVQHQEDPDRGRAGADPLNYTV